jgi:serine kinase of HPr protein (carbohydrate metabolism regulator)
LLQNLLEVRGIGLLDIRAIFGETAVRNTILHMRGIDTYQDFIDRQRRAME